jgi:hypothetical protein
MLATPLNALRLFERARCFDKGCREKSGDRGTKPPKPGFPLKCSNLARGESMKDPVSVLGRWRGFHFRLGAFRNAAKLANGCNDYLLFLALEPPDLPIEQPDLDIAAVQKLASGIERVGVRVGLDRFVRSYPIVSID